MLSLAALELVLSAGALAASSELPQVDLGYTTQQGLFDPYRRYYNFSNIRYAEPPLGENRFNTPVPVKDNQTIQNPGEMGRVCNQAYPSWTELFYNFTTAYTSGADVASYANISLAPPVYDPATLPPADPRETEDCLFLDVFAPEKVFNNRKNGTGVPVLVWIHGGGFIFGHKTGDSNAAGILSRSNDDIVYVTMNYRLGAYGWLSGPDFQANGVANVGLLDQRLALEWVQNNIAAFGGDPKQVTLMGESGGGGSVMHQITFQGDAEKPPFQQAIIQSPGWIPHSSQATQDVTFHNFLNFTTKTNIENVREMSEQDLHNANLGWIRSGRYGFFPFGPAVDDKLIPDQPQKLLLEGKFDPSLRLMIGQNSNEGLSVIPPNVQTNDVFNEYITEFFLNANASTISYITDVLYPNILDGSHGYTTQLERVSLVMAEHIYTCSTSDLATAYKGATFNYEFAVPPGTHASDVPYTYFNGTLNANPKVKNATIALDLQGFITNFVKTGNPNGDAAADHAKDVPMFQAYGTDAGVLKLNISGVGRVPDPSNNDRCRWWQLGIYDHIHP